MTLDGGEMTELLPRLGIVTLGDFARLPASQAVNRFGVPGGAAHRLARGLDPRPLAARPPSADLSASLVFDPPAELAEPVVFAAKALAERVRWQLAGWRPAQDESRDGACPSGITLLRLVPDQVVRAQGRQLGLWGDAVVSDRVARAALRVQAMPGHGMPGPAARQGGRRRRGPGDRHRAGSSLRFPGPDVGRRRTVAGDHRLG